MQSPKFTARNATKYAVKAVIHLKTASLAADTIDDYTGFDDDSTAVKIGAYMVGWYVSDKLKPLTDKAVDKTFDYAAAKREARRNKKNTEQE